jgi:hypothetical protein
LRPDNSVGERLAAGGGSIPLAIAVAIASEGAAASVQGRRLFLHQMEIDTTTTKLGDNL